MKQMFCAVLVSATLLAGCGGVEMEDTQETESAPAESTEPTGVAEQGVFATVYGWNSGCGYCPSSFSRSSADYYCRSKGYNYAVSWSRTSTCFWINSIKCFNGYVEKNQQWKITCYWN